MDIDRPDKGTRDFVLDFYANTCINSERLWDEKGGQGKTPAGAAWTGCVATPSPNHVSY